MSSRLRDVNKKVNFIKQQTILRNNCIIIFNAVLEKINSNIPIVLFTYLFLSFIGCSSLEDVKRENISTDDLKSYNRNEILELQEKSPFLKAHMKNGDLYVFNLWNIDDSLSTITGIATLYNPYRAVIKINHKYSLGLDSILLIETNEIQNSGVVLPLVIITGISVAITVMCILEPKSCFGSCPTFYVNDGYNMRLEAEGFSSSILPSLEATDIDALYNAKTFQDELSIEMRNEALETHVIRQVNLLIFPKENGQKIFHEKDHIFWQSSQLIPPNSAQSPEGDCLQAIMSDDEIERYSLADSNYLGTKEVIDLEFSVNPERSYGIVIGCRQTLLTTYLLYQTLAYMGNDAGHWLAEIERNKSISNKNSIDQLIGGIEIHTQIDEDSWHKAGTINEHGPLATDFHLLPIQSPRSINDKLKVKLRMTKGVWRLDYVALAELSKKVDPIRIYPSLVIRNNQLDHNARELLLDTTKTLVTFPGDIYTIKYKLPDKDNKYEYFLESRGYYLEWIRKEWIQEENPLMLAEILLSPEKALRRLAPEFKRIEPKMEYYFWNSRYATP